MDFSDKIVKNTDLKEGQQKALELLLTWYDSKSPEFCLSGRAGTGKTFVVNHLLKALSANVCVTAPTHKAVRVVESMTGKKGKTLQSLHGLRPNTNLETFDLNNLQFDTLGNPTFQDYDLIICDECGMINSALRALNLKRALDSNVKILYLGDPYQLPPVKERISTTFLVKDCFELTEVIRQDDDNPLLNVLDLLIKDIENSKADFLRYLIKNPKQISSKGDGYQLITDLDEFYKLNLEQFKSDEFSKNIDYCRVASWKNETVTRHNSYIRKHLIPYFSNSENSIDIIDINDIVIGYKTITTEHNSVGLTNSEDYIIQRIIPGIEFGFKLYEVELMAENRTKPLTIKIVDHKDKSFMLYYERLKSLYFKALYAPAGKRKDAWKNFFDFKNNYLSLISFNIKQGEEIKSVVKKDLDYSFSLTTHKLQGSTINNIFVDLYDMMYFSSGAPVLNSAQLPNAVEIRNKLVYTALSRAKNFAYIYFPYKPKTT